MTIRLLRFAAHVLVAGWAPVAATAQPTEMWRLGVLSPTTQAAQTTERFVLPALAELGYVKGRNLILHVREAGGDYDRLPQLARELVDARVDAILAIAPSAISAARGATDTIPIVMSWSGFDPVAMGWVASLARPGGNVTGLVMFSDELDGKRLHLLTEALPGRRRIAVLAELPRSEPSLKVMRAVAAVSGVELVVFHADAKADFGALFAAMRSSGVEALVVSSHPVYDQHAETIVRLAIEARLPTVCPWRELAAIGCLLGYGPSRSDLRRRSAQYVARIFKGTPPAEIPVEQPTVFEFGINLRTARALGIDLSPTVLARADEVIE